MDWLNSGIIHLARNNARFEKGEIEMKRPLIVSLASLLLISASYKCSGAELPAWQPAQGFKQVPIWPGKIPDPLKTKGPEITTRSEDLVGGKTVLCSQKVATPTMTVYPAKGKNTGAAVVIFPGGGFWILAMDLEGTEVAEWLTARGITCILLKYRVPGDNLSPRTGCYPKCPMALEDAQRTIRLVRSHAEEWHIDPHKVGVLGFSAGGHLVAATSNHYAKTIYKPVDAADKLSCRPDFAIALYPGHMLEGAKKPFELNPTIPVTKNTPPTFIVQAEDDPVDEVENSLAYFAALRKAGVPTEMHIYAQGKHGFGLRRTNLPITKWTDLAETWLKTIGVIKD